MWFQDEARFGQQGTLTNVWALKGTRPVVVKQTEYEWIYLYASVNAMTGESVALLAPNVNTGTPPVWMLIFACSANRSGLIVTWCWYWIAQAGTCPGICACRGM